MPSLYELAQYWGGLFYLLSKIFFWSMERVKTESRERLLRIFAWASYLLGLPGWLCVFGSNHNWIAASIEAGGAPGMTLGLVNAWRGIKADPPKWLDNIARLAVGLGFGYSIWYFSGITTWNQVLEIGMTTGFLVGIYLLAKNRPAGYLWFMLMIGSNIVLQYIQDTGLLVIQQIISMGFIVDAYRTRRKRIRSQS